ncbi:HTH-type transcriptional activator RhaS [Mycolicibacterium chlorophenolicum]|uniref:HTH-type transcriptional activator RhaS n=1 Tax=Mycolicibacterium chlorophenolicum TaxID=37916 RepID=A0A0J6VB52_9MYCO|nr:HTH-type transcriptional activator RhaS [Mycolicibacterium chlorophenolicum]
MTVEPLSRWALIRSTSVGECERSAAALLAEHRLHIPETAKLNASVNGISVGGVSLFYMSYRAHLKVTAPPLAAFMAVCVPLEGSLELRQGRTRFEARAGRGAVLLSFDEPFEMRWSPDLSMFCYRIDVSTLRDFATTLDSPADNQLTFAREVTDLRVVESLRGCARVTELAVAQCIPGQSIAPSLAARLRDHILLTTLVAQPNSWRPEFMAKDFGGGRAAISAAVDYIEAHPLSATPNAVAISTCMSLRALQENFRRSLGTTPHAYILKTRLRRAHEELQAADPGLGATVTDVARRWGFTNVGRFADRYARTYGQTPSQTLRGTRRGDRSSKGARLIHTEHGCG